MLWSLVSSHVSGPDPSLFSPLPPDLGREVLSTPEFATEVGALRGVAAADGGAADTVLQQLVVVLAFLLLATEGIWETEMKAPQGVKHHQ